MKRKLIASVLAMMLSLVPAIMGLASWNDAPSQGMQVGPDGSITTSGTTENGQYTISGSQHTDFWLRSYANAQIDVTVPLLVVMTTETQGGAITGPTNYGFTNNSNYDLEIREITARNPSTATVTLVGTAPSNTDLDKLFVQLGFGGTQLAMTDGFSQTNTFPNADMIVPKKTTVPGNKQVSITGVSSPLSFITSTSNGSALQSPDNGVHALQVKYTLGISFDVEGTTIGTQVYP